MKIESEKVLVNADIQTVYSFLMNSENLINILPKDKISDWKATEKDCSFKAQGGFLIPLIQESSEEPTLIVLKSGEKAPFSFKLNVNLSQLENGTEGYISFDGDVNMFMKMMVEKPLTNLFNYMSHKLKVYYEIPA